MAFSRCLHLWAVHRLWFRWKVHPWDLLCVHWHIYYLSSCACTELWVNEEFNRKCWVWNFISPTQCPPIHEEPQVYHCDNSIAVDGYIDLGKWLLGKLHSSAWQPYILKVKKQWPDNLDSFLVKITYEGISFASSHFSNAPDLSHLHSFVEGVSSSSWRIWYLQG